MRRLVVTVVGVFPAFALCFFLLPASIAVVGEYVDTGDRGRLIDLVWCFFGIIGTFALFFSIEKAPGPIKMTGLVMGIAAMWGLDGFSIVSSGPWNFFFYGPVVVAVLLIIEGLHTLYKGANEPDRWSM